MSGSSVSAGSRRARRTVNDPARAFNYDPAVCYLLPHPARRERAMRFAFSCYLRYGKTFGVVDTSAAGAAI